MFGLKNPRAKRSRFLTGYAAATAAAGIMGMPGGCPGAGFELGDGSFIRQCIIQNIPRRIPGAVGDLAEVPGVTFAAGKITPGLVNGKIVFGAGEVNGADEAINFVIYRFQCGLTGQLTLTVRFHRAAARCKSLFF